MDGSLSRAELAEKYFREGYNCSQAVVLAFSDILDTDLESLKRISSSFGGGMGRLREVCGAFSGMLIVLGYVAGYAAPETGPVKAEHYKRIQELARLFSEANGGSIVCRELLHLDKSSQNGTQPSPRTEEFYRKRPCLGIIGNAAVILDKYLKENDLI
ncbi:MAG: C_GCAxxG_C_C family protein [Clostridia bacterium]|nr:C_GCAxxG_C_C family protein [Clostridia bacterium]